MVTPAYRAPELIWDPAVLLADDRVQYSDSIDVWSGGCIVAELFTKIPLFHVDDGTTLPEDAKWASF